MGGEDSEHALANHVDAHCDYNNLNSHFARRIVGELDALLNEHNELLKLLKSHMPKLQSDNHAIVINPDRTPAGELIRRFNTTVVDYVAVIMVGDRTATRHIESKLLDQRKFDLFQNNNLYESAPPSASIVSPKRDLPSINPPYSAPLLAETYHDIVSVENLIREENVSCKTHQNYTEIRKSLESPHSEISGIEELSSSPVRVFSDSSVSWFPDSEEDRCFKKKRRVYVAKSSRESDSEESTFIASRSKTADSRGLFNECFQDININNDFQSRNKQYAVPQQSTLPSSNSDSSGNVTVDNQE
ncbi:unnamed protein product [Parnassius apollo]|uniref:(apollo) hypothetical protein n=1 Tax=Parnassius apollo TaxID=110799 RepID=A0A8S3Y3I5_PARAO|nr:unnamed protein product [Parnassius apollo]